MELIGNFLSPFARRVAVSLNALGLTYTMKSLIAFGNAEKIQPHNPLIRVPTLILSDGEVLVESYAILDYLDELADVDKRLIPSSGTVRRQIMKDTAVAVGTMDRTQWAIYEYRRRPEEKVHVPWVEHNDMCAVGGLKYLDDLAERVNQNGWLSGTNRISQSDISAVVSYSFAEKVRPELNLIAEVPALGAFAARCEAMDIFAASPVPD